MPPTFPLMGKVLPILKVKSCSYGAAHGFKWKVHESTEQKLTHTASRPTRKPSSMAEGTAGGNQVKEVTIPLARGPISSLTGSAES